MKTRWINHNILASSSGTNLDSKSMLSRGILQLMSNSINFFCIWIWICITCPQNVLPTLLFTITCNLYLGQTYWGMTMRYICHTFEDKILTANISWRFFVSPKDNLRKYRRNSQQIFKNRVSFINQLSNGFKKPQQREY